MYHNQGCHQIKRGFLKWNVPFIAYEGFLSFQNHEKCRIPAKIRRSGEFALPRPCCMTCSSEQPKRCEPCLQFSLPPSYFVLGLKVEDG